MRRLIGKTVRQLQFDRGRVNFAMRRINQEPGNLAPVEKLKTGPGIDWNQFKDKGKERNA